MTNCWLPYYHAEIQTNGSVRPCCKYTAEWIDSIADYTNKNRQDFLENDLPDACLPCKVSDDIWSYRTMRTAHFSKFWPAPTSPKLKSLNLSIDNICSNSCLQCSASNSSTIAYLHGQKESYSWNLDMLDDYLPDLEFLTVSGGEPLQSYRFVALCEKISRLCKNLKIITVPTSCYKLHMRNITALANLNVPVVCRISINGPWPLNAYIRGCDEKVWLDNLELLKRYKFRLCWQVTIGSYNVFALPETVSYLDSLLGTRHITPSPVIFPETHSVKQMADNLKIATRKKLLSFMPNPSSRDLIRTAIDLLDQPRTLEWQNCISSIESIPKLRTSPYNLAQFISHYLTD